jgi:acyl-CoA synthetase (AMP-forming)/AMP-acid ligase II
MNMYALREDDVVGDLSLLDRAWRGLETFVFTPRKSGISDEWIAAAMEQVPEALRGRHFCLLTSGSTGRPKLIIGSRERAEALARLLHSVQESEDAKQAVVLLPLSYSYAFVNQWLWARVCGRTLVPTRGFADPSSLRDALRDTSESLVCMVGGQLRLLADHFAEEQFPGVSRLHFAGGPFPQDRLEELRRTFPSARVFNNYGCAEAMPRLTVRRAEDGASSRDIGRPLPGIELRSDESSALVFRSPFGAVGWIDGEGFHAIERDTWTATGDLGVEVATGRFELLGRAGEVFKRYGEKVSLAALRSTVLGAWRGDAGFYRERDRAGEEGHVLVLAPHPTTTDVRGVLAALRAHHRRPHWPLRIESAERLPLLANGKPDVRAAAAGERQVHWDQRT